ncbi:hypothetical protein LXA43DRAFT_736158 [Ganoderma leucocontextum]|nr:hypothetical protein LXA43DRAFT_736158 [Ganoderma leucocontextum]
MRLDNVPRLQLSSGLSRELGRILADRQAFRMRCHQTCVEALARTIIIIGRGGFAVSSGRVRPTFATCFPSSELTAARHPAASTPEHPPPPPRSKTTIGVPAITIHRQLQTDRSFNFLPTPCGINVGPVGQASQSISSASNDWYEKGRTHSSKDQDEERDVPHGRRPRRSYRTTPPSDGEILMTSGSTAHETNLSSPFICAITR